MSSHAPSKLPKFLQKSTRDRSKSMVDPSVSSSSGGGGSSSVASSSSSSSPLSDSSKSTTHTRKSSKKSFGFNSHDKQRWPSQDNNHNNNSSNNNMEPEHAEDGGSDGPVIIEPAASAPPRARTRSERPLSDNYPAQQLYSSPSNNSRLSDLPNRLSGWFSHTFSSSTTDLALSTILSQQTLAASSAASPKGKASALLTAARHGKGSPRQGHAISPRQRCHPR